MKTLFNIIALVAISASSILANPTGGDDNTTNNNKKSFAIGTYRGAGTLDLHVTVDKLEGKAVTILVKDKEGRIVNREHIAKYKSNYHGRFDFSEAKDGQYTIEVTDGKDTISKTVSLENQTSTTEYRLMTVE
ncbi:hypothetical protein QM480_21920 [Flectobacillus sp. DC10W]|jgi:hypothetical protein|uniref:Uncharacterized protein n=1 Tax=Flectobacillus longus TaxID=2984207 RepID=A0ABT6YV89_9BACT|nr:hypothetical protein [Flectobacillus longus]MDI9867013.1 hypothetical protein [Flectobacillus longus]